MKKLLVLSAFAMSGLVAFAQGTINFNNRVPGSGVNAPVQNGSGVLLSGTQFQAQLMAGLDAGSLIAVGTPLSFKTGSLAGYFGITTAVVVPSVAPGGIAVAQIRAWNTQAGATYSDAVTTGWGYGASKIFDVKTGGDGSPPSVPGDMINLGTSGWSLSVVPEPSVMALGLLGAVGLLIRRRKA